MFNHKKFPKSFINNHPLWQAILSGSVDELKQLSEEDWLISTFPAKENNLTRYLPTLPLGLAITQANLSIVQFLVSERKILFFKGDDYNALAEATYHGKFDILKYLIEKCGFQPDDNILRIAICAGHLEMAKYLAYQFFLLRPLHQDKKLIDELSKRNHFAVLKWLVEDHQFPITENSFLLACEFGSHEMVKWYIENQQASWNKDNEKDGQFPQYRARIGGKIETFQYLLEKNIGPNFEWISLGEISTDMIIHICNFLPPKMFFNLSLTNKALNYKTNSDSFVQHQWKHYFPRLNPQSRQFLATYAHALTIRHTNLKFDTCAKLMSACITDDLESFKKIYLIIEKPGDAIWYFFSRPFPYSDSNEYIYSFLLRINKHVCLNYFCDQLTNLKSKYYSPFIIAARLGRLDLMITQLKANPDLVNVTEDARQPALIWAARHGYVPIIEYLINKNNTDLLVKTVFENNVQIDRTPLDWAIINRHLAAIPILLKIYAEKAPDFEHSIYNRFLYTVKQDWADVLLVLIEHDPEILRLTESEKQELLKQQLNTALSKSYDAVAKILLSQLSVEAKKEFYAQYSSLPTILLSNIKNKIRKINSNKEILYIRQDTPILVEISKLINKLILEFDSDNNQIIKTMLAYIHEKVANLNDKYLISLINDLLKDTFKTAFGHTDFLLTMKINSFNVVTSNLSVNFWDDLAKEMKMLEQVEDKKQIYQTW